MIYHQRFIPCIYYCLIQGFSTAVTTVYILVNVKLYNKIYLTYNLIRQKLHDTPANFTTHLLYRGTVVRNLWSNYCLLIISQYIAAIIPSDNNKIRFVAGLLMLSVTYVIGDMYSASLTSILARPPKGYYYYYFCFFLIFHKNFEFGIDQTKLFFV